MKNFYERVWRIVKKIPRGKVTAYGDIARILGSPNSARTVGYAMRASKNIPWYRVVNSKGMISTKDKEIVELQKELLKIEGIVFENGKIDLKKYKWNF
ncbi:MAG: MGMT family protein [Candidatus Methanofastidiosia archaeon]